MKGLKKFCVGVAIVAALVLGSGLIGSFAAWASEVIEPEYALLAFFLSMCYIVGCIIAEEKKDD